MTNQNLLFCHVIPDYGIEIGHVVNWHQTHASENGTCFSDLIQVNSIHHKCSINCTE